MATAVACGAQDIAFGDFFHQTLETLAFWHLTVLLSRVAVVELKMENVRGSTICTGMSP
jgi:hypothetical protein